jgi:hypothetical protein
MVIFSHVDGIIKKTLDMLDELIDTFIQTGRRRWDFGHLIFYREPIYDIEGSPQEKGFEFSCSEDYFSCVYNSYVWQPDDDMITDLFEHDGSQHFQDDFQSSLGTLMHIFFGMQICCMRTLSHLHPQFWKNTSVGYVLYSLYK